MGQNILLARSAEWEDKHKYEECLLWLVQSFARLLGRLDVAIKQGFSFSVGGRPYRESLLQQRSAECLAVGLVNLPVFHAGVGKLREHLNEVRFITLLMLTPLNQRLARSFHTPPSVLST